MNNMSGNIVALVNGVKQMPGWQLQPGDRDKYIVQALQPYGFTLAGEGQNRVVVSHPNYPDRVWKIAHREAGLRDNMGEYTISAIYGQLQMTMPTFARALVNPSIPVSNNMLDYQVIEEQKVADVRSYVQRSSSGHLGYDAVKFLVENYQSYIDLMRNLGKAFFIYDAHPKNPFNFGLATAANGNYLVTLDYGYYLPYKDTNSLGTGVDRPLCPKCNSKLEYLIPNLPNNLTTTDKIQLLTANDSVESTERYKCCNHTTCGTVYTAGEVFEKMYQINRI